MAADCIFCGNHPLQKTKEHVFPRWLLKLTGNPKRIVSFGIPGGPVRQALDQFQFPACKRCNESFGILEEKAKPVVLELLEGGALDHSQAETLLDWFDKIRLGAWLAALQVGENPLRVRPVFHIETRMRKQDRLLYLGHVQSGAKDLCPSRLWDPVFQGVPSFFWLHFNGLSFVNLSSFNAASGPLGLPVVRFGEFMPEARTWDGELVLKPQKTNWPAIQEGFSLLAQGVWPAKLHQSDVRGAIVPDGDRSIVHLRRGRIVSTLPLGGSSPAGVLSAPFPNESQLLDAAGWLFVKIRRWVTRQLEFDPRDEAYSKYVSECKKSGEEIVELVREQRAREKGRKGTRRRRV